jgi:hypothetical protein
VSTNLTPTEAEEAYTLVDYLRLKGLFFCHINNEMYTKSWNQKRRMLAMGSAKGLPDYLIVVGNRLVFIELKRVKGSVTSPEQLKWLAVLDMIPGVTAAIARGAEQAINIIEEVRK